MVFNLNISHKFIIAWLSLSAFLHNILMNGANNVIISSLQKEFYLSSRETGVYVSVYDIGSLLSSIFISFAAARGSKPRWIAFGMIMLFIGCMVNVLPHFLKPNEFSQEALEVAPVKNDAIIELCNHSISVDDTQPIKHFARNLSHETTKLISTSETPQPAAASWFQLKHLLYLANLINGLSSASMTSITFSYIEDIAPSHKLSSIYEAIYFVLGAFGVGVGFMITSSCLKIHTDVNRMGELPSWLKPSHPNWIGAWWIPYLIFGIVSFFLALVIAIFPRKLSHKHESNNSKDLKQLHPLKNGKLIENESGKKRLDSVNTDVETIDNEADTQERSYEDNRILDTLREAGSILSLNKIDIKKETQTSVSTESYDENNSLLKKSLFLFKKPAYILVIICAAIEGLLQNSFLAFATLFLEYQYRLASGSASLILGLLSIPPLIIGGLLSGFIVSRFKNDPRKCFKFIAIVLFVNIFVYAGFMLYCKEPNMVSIENTHSLDGGFTVAEDCNCNKKMFKPVCLKGSNDTFYQTACLAGCFSFDKDTESYSNCTQIPTTFTDPASSYFINGLCPTDSSCTTRLIVSYLCIFLLMFMNALTFLPFLKAAIGCIDSEEMNSIGLGMKQFFMNAFGTIPGPILFGSVIDSTCMHWHDDMNDQRVCKLYNNKNFAFGFGALGVGFKIVCFILILLAIKFTKKRPSQK